MVLMIGFVSVFSSLLGNVIVTQNSIVGVVVTVLVWSEVDVSSRPECVKPKTIKLVFAASLLHIQF